MSGIGLERNSSPSPAKQQFGAERAGHQDFGGARANDAAHAFLLGVGFPNVVRAPGRRPVGSPARSGGRRVPRSAVLSSRAAYSTRVNRTLARNSAIAAGAVAVNGLLSAVLLALCAAFGQTGEIAAYTVMTSALAFVSI